MKIKTEGGTMTAKGKSGLVSKLRFPEFRQAGDWEKKELCEVATIIRKKAGSNKYTLMSVTAGVGLISQLEKFGREIAGAQYKNYLVIEHNDFAYNKSATKEYPEGFIGMYSGNEPGAVPNSIFTCFRVDTNAVVPKYLNYLFFWNLHGKWLKKFITVGARAHGSLNIDDNDLLALPVPFPRGSNSITEQQKIADCLSALDELISAQAHKLDTLKAHKKGLMQQLFPAPGQTTPTLRFPEFRNAGEWGEYPLSKFIKTLDAGVSVNSGDRPACDAEFGILKTSAVTNGIFEPSENKVVVDSGEQKRLKESVQAHTIIISRMNTSALVGANAYIDTSMDNIFLPDRLWSAKPQSGTSMRFIAYTLGSEKGRSALSELATGTSGSMKNITKFDVLGMQILSPDFPEQQKIADCLSSLDELIAPQTHKLDILKAHKKGLMQQLFPNPDKAAE